MIILAKKEDKEIMSMSATTDNENELINALTINCNNLGFANIEIEILTDEEYEIRKSLEPLPEIPLTEEQQRLLDLEMAIASILGGGI